MYGFNLTPKGSGWYELRWVNLDDAKMMYNKKFLGNIRMTYKEFKEFQKEHFISFDNYYDWNHRRKAELKILSIVCGWGHRCGFEVIFVDGDITNGMTFECTDKNNDGVKFRNDVNNIIDALEEKYSFLFKNHFNVEVTQDHSDDKILYTVAVKDYHSKFFGGM